MYTVTRRACRELGRGEARTDVLNAVAALMSQSQDDRVTEGEQTSSWGGGVGGA